MLFVLFHAFFFTSLLFCGFVAFAQWQLSRDEAIPFYIGYLLCAFAHYFRQFWLDMVELSLWTPPFDPPLRWDTPLSYASTACYLFFVWQVMTLPGSPLRYYRLLAWVGRFYVGMIAVHLLLQVTCGKQTAEAVHCTVRMMLYGPMVWMSVLLLRTARLPYQRLIVAGALALTIGFLGVIFTNLFPRQDYFRGVLSGFQMPWGKTIYLYHLKVGIALDVLLFSWAITLRQQMLLRPTQVPPPTASAPPQHLPAMPIVQDRFLEHLHDFLDSRLGDEHLRVGDVAVALFLSTSQTNRKIKEKTGLTTEQYLLRYRLRHAHQLLRETPAPIGEIADQVGFKTVAHFSHAFKREFGQPPSEMRRKGAGLSSNSDIAG